MWTYRSEPMVGTGGGVCHCQKYQADSSLRWMYMQKARVGTGGGVYS